MPPLPLKLSHGVIHGAIEILKDIRSYVHDACAEHSRTRQLRFAVIPRKAIPCWIAPNESQILIKRINYGWIAIIRLTPNSAFGRHGTAHDPINSRRDNARLRVARMLGRRALVICAYSEKLRSPSGAYCLSACEPRRFSFPHNLASQYCHRRVLLCAGCKK